MWYAGDLMWNGMGRWVSVLVEAQPRPIRASRVPPVDRIKNLFPEGLYLMSMNNEYTGTMPTSVGDTWCHIAMYSKLFDKSNVKRKTLSSRNYWRFPFLATLQTRYGLIGSHKLQICPRGAGGHGDQRPSNCSKLDHLLAHFSHVSWAPQTFFLTLKY